LVVATIFVQEGSAPRTAGTKMAVLGDGTPVGTIGGGLLEATVLREASRVRGTGDALLHPFDLTKSDVAGMDMICGGRLQVLVEGVDASPENARVFAALAQRLDQGRSAVLVTALGSQGQGPWPTERCLLVEGKTVGPLALSEDAQTRIQAAGAGGKEPALILEGGRRLFVEPFAAAARVYFFGAGHVTQETEALARHVGFRTTVVDDRPEFANRERYPDAEGVRSVPSFDGAVQDLPLDADAYVVIMTRGHSFDGVVLARTLQTPVGYVGMIGSRHKWRAIQEALRGQGFRQEDLDRVRCPIGLEIGAETPAEIAVSIVGELIRERARKGA
jgi:xanthine dehydrogenase accessory factor